MKNRNRIMYSFLFGMFKHKLGDPIQGVHVYLETEPGKKLVAFQETGGSGSVTFRHLDKGVYKIFAVLPQPEENQEANEKPQEESLLVAYHSKKNIAFFNNPPGYYTVKYSDIENLNNSNITPMFEQEQNEINPRLAIAKVEVTGKYGSLTLKVASLSQKKFQKRIDHYKEDADMAIIQNNPVSLKA
jgi:hypothetical protein